MRKAVYILIIIFSTQFLGVSQGSDVKQLLNEAIDLVESSPEESIELTQKAFKLARRQGDIYRMVSAKNVMGYISLMLNDYESAYINYTDALEYLEKTDTVDLYNKATILSNLALIKSSYSDHEGAAFLYQKAHETAIDYVRFYPEAAELNGDLEMLIDFPYGRAIELVENGQHLLAGEILIGMWEDSEHEKDTILLAKVVNQLGLIKHENKEYVKAQNFFAIAALNEKVDPSIRASALHNLAVTFMEQEDYVKAKNYFNESLGLKKEYSGKEAQFITLLDLGELSFVQGDYTGAISIWETAINTYDGLKNDPDLFIVYDWLQKAYRQSDINKAIEYSDLYASNFKGWMTIQSNQRDTNPTLQAFNTRIDTILSDRALKAERLALLRRYWPMGVAGLLIIMLFVYLVQLSFNRRRERVFEASLKADRASVADEILNRIRRDEF
ncbi:MAG: tetratricopeptide (TPR) repeat protein [Roseivirga sp.]|jgi:tetratricopeptide (TPR) repeat protein